MQTANLMRRQILAALKAVGGLLEGAIVRLIKEPIAVGPTTTIAELDAAEADYTGYVEQAAGAWGTVGTNVLNQAEMTATELEFVPSGTTILNTIYGYYVVDSGGTELRFFEMFDTPFAMDGTAAVLRIVPRMAYPED